MNTPPDQLALGQGYYSFNPPADVPLKFIVLDSIAENGGDGGNIDEEQYQWLEDELDESQDSGELVMVFAHHTLDTMNQPSASPFPPGDQGGNPNPHRALRYRAGRLRTTAARRAPRRGRRTARRTRRCAASSCATRPWSDSWRGTSIRTRSCRSSAIPGRAQPRGASGRLRPRRTSTGPSSRAHWTWSTTATERCRSSARSSTTAARRTPAAPPAPRDGQGSAAASVQRLASISRELSFNDPDSANGEDGRSDARGGEEDRNVELLVRDPFQGP